MSIKRMDSVWKLSRQKGSGLLVLLSLADRADNGGFCWPGLDDIAKRARISRRQVIRMIQKLEEDGELFVFRDEGKPNRYLVPHGLGVVEFGRGLIEKFEMDEDSAIRKIEEMMGGELLSWGDKMARVGGDIFTQVGVSSEAAGGDAGVMGGVTPMSPEPSRTINESSRLSMADIFTIFWSASKIPPPSNGGRDFQDWEDGATRLISMEATKGEIERAVEMLEGKGYNYRSPGSLVNTIAQLRRDEKKVEEKKGQRFGGDFVS